MTKFITIVFVGLLFVPAVLLSTASADNSEQWFLMSRHGECAEIRVLQRKIPDMGNIKDPQAFILLMEEKGYKVISSEMKELQGMAFDVKVPEKELNLMFVKGSLCEEFINR